MSVRRPLRVIGVACVLVLVLASAAFALPGDVDQTFGTDGHTTVDIQGIDRVAGIDRQSMGKIIVGGDNFDFRVTRLTTDGEPDVTFGVGGVQTVPITGASSATAKDMTIQSNDKILVAGFMLGPSPLDDRMVVARFRSGGAPDTSFGVGGVRKIGFAGADAYAYGVGVQPDGRIVVVGEYDPPGDGASRVAVVRLRSDGMLDPTFGDGGRKVISRLGGDTLNFVNRVRFTPKGRLVLAGGRQVTGIETRTIAIRLLPGGRLDGSFGGDGIVVVNVRPNQVDRAVGLELRGGKVLLAVGGVFGQSAVVRLTSTGALDGTFSGNGIDIRSISGFQVSDLAVNGSGILVSDSNGGRLLRLTFAGAVDAGFGSSGVAVDPAGPAGANAIELQSGKILLAGTTSGATVVSRFLGT